MDGHIDAMTETRKPRIAILETGAPPSDLSPEHGRYPQMFTRLLGEGFEARTIDVRPARATSTGSSSPALPPGFMTASPGSVAC